MIFGLFILAVALSISGVAAYYSIAGLAAIFAAAVVPVIIMGAVLEVGKIAATVWLHKFWHQANLKFKLYLVPAILILMMITSLGIFGFLSKAHMDQTLVSGDIGSQVQIIDEKILLERDNVKTQRDNIAAAKTALAQMDSQVNARLDRGTDERSAERAVQIRKTQAKERTALQKDIQTAQKEIDAINTRISKLNEERIPFAAEVRKVEAEVGPIKYIAALIYGDNPDSNLLERAVRWVIILLVLVFDPLALILILAAEQTIEWAREDKRKTKKDNEAIKQGWHQEWVPDSEAWPKYEDDDGPLTNEQLEEIKNLNAAYQSLTPNTKLFDTEEEFFAHGKEIARELDAQEDRLPEDYASTQAYLKGPVSWFKSTGTEGWVPKPELVDEDPLDIPLLEGEEMWAQEAIDGRFDPQPIRGFQPPADDEAPINPLPKPVVIEENQIVIPDTSISLVDRPANASFGTEFPTDPQRGDMFLRVDYLPNRSYKWNGKKWIDINSEQYAYDEEYIKHLIDRIDQGDYTVDLLTETEQEQIQRYLNEQSTRK
jgi:hypothetical protein